MSRQKETARAKQFWNHMDMGTLRNVSWSAIPYFEEQIAYRLTKKTTRGSRHPLAEASTALVWEMLTRRLPVARRTHLVGCSLVCGDMGGHSFFEQASGICFHEVHGYDLSAQALASYEPTSLTFHAHNIDCNDLILGHEQFHLIVGCHGIHHVMNVGGLFYQAHKALVPEGLMLLHEWIGPNFLQLHWTNRWIARLLLHVLFPRRASRTMQNGTRKERWVGASAEAWDPSEACNAEDLWPQYVRFFRPLHTVFYGGLVFPVFDGLGHHFRPERWTHQVRIRLVYALERVLTRLRVIRPLFVTTIGEKRVR